MAIAANSVGYAVGIFSVLPGFAINLGLTAIVSRCVGANDYNQARYYTKKCLVLTFISHISINAIIFVGLPLILSIYNLSPQTASMTSQMIIWHGIFGIIIWPLSFTIPSTFRGAGDSKSVMYISLIVMFTCRIALSYVIAYWMGIGVFGTWIAMFIDWYVRAGIYIYRYFSNKWTHYRVIES
jgi:Na+-driven multidrug efflux pump